jgi:hypothetical protein
LISVFRVKEKSNNAVTDTATRPAIVLESVDELEKSGCEL